MSDRPQDDPEVILVPGGPLFQDEPLEPELGPEPGWDEEEIGYEGTR